MTAPKNPNSNVAWWSSCNQDCNQGRECDCAEAKDIAGMWDTIIIMAVIVGVAVITIVERIVA